MLQLEPCLHLWEAIVYYSTFDFAELEQSEMELLSVELVEIDSIDNRITLNLVFGVTNHGERTVTVPEIGLISFLLMKDRWEALRILFQIFH